MKEDILRCILESLSLLEEIPVTGTSDCYRKVQIHDRLAAVHNALTVLELIEKKEESDGDDKAEHHEG